MLKLSNVNAFYGSVHALKDASLEVGEGEIAALIGSNGAGKTTTLGCITGLVPAASGTVSYRGEDITNTPTHRLVRRGISLSPEGREVFPALTAEENLRLGAYTRKTVPPEAFERVYALFPRLKERRSQAAGTLSGGEQQMLAIARALMSEPALLLLDEPSLGLAPNIVLQIFDLIKRINAQGVTILLVEQNANLALLVSQRAYVLETGRIVMSGPSQTLAKDEGIKRAYLGTGRTPSGNGD